MTDKAIGARWWSLTPGSGYLAATAMSLLERDQVDPGSWLTPVHVFCAEDEAQIIVEMASEESGHPHKHTAAPWYDPRRCMG